MTPMVRILSLKALPSQASRWGTSQDAVWRAGTAPGSMTMGQMFVREVPVEHPSQVSSFDAIAAQVSYAAPSHLLCTISGHRQVRGRTSVAPTCRAQ
jgi:hypothetical protein